MAKGKQENIVVIDNGSSLIRVGLMHKKEPTTAIPSVVGRLRHQVSDESLEQILVGEETIPKGNLLTITRPYQNGIISNWEDMERIWHHTFYKTLKVDLTDSKAILTVPILFPASSKDRMKKVMLQNFGFNAVHIMTGALAILTSGGLQTGITLDIGYQSIVAVPFFDGHPLIQAIGRLTFGGNDLTRYMFNLLEKRGITWTNKSEGNAFKDMKEKLCYVPLDYKTEVTTFDISTEGERAYTLTDGNVTHLSRERIKCPEALFSPTFIGLSCQGVQDMLFSSIMKCKPESRKQLYKNIVLAGGSSLFPGLPQRLEKELADLAPVNFHITVHAEEDRANAAWIGASMFAKSAEFVNV